MVKYFMTTIRSNLDSKKALALKVIARGELPFVGGRDKFFSGKR